MRYLIIIVLVFTFTGCAFIPFPTWEAPKEIDTLEKAQAFMQSVKPDYADKYDNWKTPEETFLTMFGDCEDLSGLLANIMIYNLNYSDVRLVGCIHRSSSIPHMLVYADGKYYESRTGRELRKFDNVYIFVNFLKYESYVKLAKII